MQLEDLKARLHIDRNRLEEVAETHADLFFDSAVELEEAKERLALLENRASLAEAELLVQVKKDPLAYNLETASDKVAESIVKSDPTVQALRKDVADLKKEVAIRGRFLESLNQRKSMINDLVSLHGQSYFAKPTTTPATAQANKTAARVPMKLPEKPATTRPTKPKS